MGRLPNPLLLTCLAGVAILLCIKSHLWVEPGCHPTRKCHPCRLASDPPLGRANAGVVESGNSSFSTCLAIVAILTNSRMAPSRLPYVRTTWAKRFSHECPHKNVFYFMESDYPGVEIVNCSSDKYFGRNCKSNAALQHLWARGRAWARWFVVLDDDNYIVPSNYEAFFAQLTFEDVHYVNCVRRISGGCGHHISRGMMKKIHDTHQMDFWAKAPEMHDDVAISRFVHQIGARITLTAAMHVDNFNDLLWTARNPTLAHNQPIMFHHMSPLEMIVLDYALHATVVGRRNRPFEEFYVADQSVIAAPHERVWP